MSPVSVITLTTVLVAFPLVISCSEVTERDILVYLQHVGHYARLDPQTDPVFYANDIPDEWNLNDVRVQQLVGPICGRLVPDNSIDYEDMLYACSIFEMLGARYLRGVWQAVINTMEDIPHEKRGIWTKNRKGSTGKRIASLAEFETPYNEHQPKLGLSHVREMFPAVCTKLDRGIPIMNIPPFESSLAKDGCVFIKELAVGFLKGIEQRNTGVYSGKMGLNNQVSSQVSFMQVKTMLPMVCEENGDLQASSSWCDAFFRNAYIRLNGTASAIPSKDLKPFIFHICNKRETKENKELNRRCNDYLKNSLEKFM